MTTPDEQTPRDPGDEHIPIEPSQKRASEPGPESGPARRPVPPKDSVTEGMTEAELERIERESEPPPRKPRVRSASAEGEIPKNALGAPGRLGWRFPAGAGVMAIVAAVVLAWIYAPADTSGWRAALKQLIDAPLYAWVGVGAVLVAAHLQSRPFGGIHLVLARMTLAVGVFALLWQLAKLLVVEQELAPALRWPLAAIPGAFLYFFWTMYAYRLNREGAAMIGALHLAAWFVLFLFRLVAA
jgi:hypothetical protein